MSVIVLAPKQYRRVLATMLHDRYDFRKPVSNFYRYADEAEIKRIVNAWYQLNAHSYACRYREEYTAPPEILDKGGPTLSPYELLRALESIAYQIEMSTIQEKRHLTYSEEKDHEVLTELISMTYRDLIRNTEEYKAASTACYIQ